MSSTENRALVIYQPPPPRDRNKFAWDTAKEICDWIALGESLAAVCRKMEIPERTVMGWLRKYPQFAQDYAQAREDQADHDADQITDIRKALLVGLIDFQTARVAIDALKWAAGKRAPKKYGDRLVLTGADGGPIQVEAVRASISGKLDSLAASIERARTADQPADD